MAGDKLPSVQSLDRPENLQEILRQDRGDDCLSCKVVGECLSEGVKLRKCTELTQHSQAAAPSLALQPTATILACRN